jgi:hypothetical protein
LNNFTTGVCEREEANRTRVAGHLDEIQGVMASTLKLHRDRALGFIDWLDLFLHTRDVGRDEIGNWLVADDTTEGSIH